MRRYPYLRFSGRRTPADDVGGEAPVSPAPNRGPKGEHQQGGPCTGEDGSIVQLVPPPTGVPRESISRADPVQGEMDQ